MKTLTRIKATGRFVVKHSCPSCQLIRINGVVCHETGCPDAWRDETRKCKWCGSEFTPEESYQTCCDQDCYNSYHGH